MAETERFILGYDEQLLFQTEEDRNLAIEKIKNAINTKGSFSINELVHDWGFNTDSDHILFNGLPYSYYPNKFKDLLFNDFEPIGPIDFTIDSFNVRFGLRIFSLQPVSNQESGQTLNVYFVAFSRHKGKEWIANAGYIFAKDEESLEALLNKQYGEVRIRSAQKVDIR